jgi:high-affinity iron transporter
MTLARWLLALLFVFVLPAQASETAQTIVHMLDYVAVDYPEFVKDGKVLDETEYKEQQEFSAQVLDLLAKLPDAPQRAKLLEQAAALKKRIDARAPGAEIAKLAGALRWDVIGVYRA